MDPKENKGNKHFMIPLFLVVFISLLGVGIIIPILSMIFLDPARGIFPADFPMGLRTILLGFLIGSYPLMQFFGSPIIGALSDRYGRKRLLITSLIATTIGYMIFGWGILAKNIYLLFLGRMIDGFMGGNIVVAYSAIADISDAKSKPKNFGIVGMAFGLGFIIGPYIGGILADSKTVSWFNFATPMWFSALLCLINIVLVIYLFKETLRSCVKTKISFFTGIKNIKKAMSFAHLRILFIIIFLVTLGFNFYSQFMPVYLIEKFSMNESEIGLYFAYQGLWIAITQGLLNRFISGRNKPENIIRICLIALSASLFLMLVPQNVNYLYLVTPLMPIFWGLTWPNTLTIVSGLASKESQGEIMGINQSFQSLGMTIPPIISGFIVSIHMYLPILISGSMVLLSWLVFMFLFEREKSRSLRKFEGLVYSLL